MSGGFFDHEEYRLIGMADRLLEQTRNEIHSDRSRDLFLKTVKDMQSLYMRLQHIDYYLEGDHSEEAMHKEIEEDKCI